MFRIDYHRQVKGRQSPKKRERVGIVGVFEPPHLTAVSFTTDIALLPGRWTRVPEPVPKSGGEGI